jgi:predicted ATPase with chaperone activity
MDPITIHIPAEPESVADTGLAETTLEQLILKTLYFRGDVYGQDLSQAIGLKFSVIQDLVEGLKLQHLVQVKRSLGMGSVGALLSLTETGRARAREALESNQYAGPAPVPIEQYTEMIRRQRPRRGWLIKESLAKAFSGMVVTERVLSQLGPAISAANSMLIYGKPGDGKTFLIESLQNLEASAIFVPYAVECQGNIVQIFDPIYHRRTDEEVRAVNAIARESSYDARWCRCRRPFIVSGGELTLDMLDLRYNSSSKVYEAPFQLKANNGIYLIDDFGRQRATPAEVLNRWIVPMERKADYLSFLTGGKMTVPFEAFLVFSTNLNPADLGDEAFLRRIQYKMRLHGPSREEFLQIFERVCNRDDLHLEANMEEFLEKHYRRPGRPFRRCHPRDLLSHAMNLIHFEKLPNQITMEVLERAFESCFVADEDDADIPASPILVQKPVRPCSEYLGERFEEVPTVFGRLAHAASFRDRGSNTYRYPEAGREYQPEQIATALAGLHERIFREWLGMNLEQRSRDLMRYLSTVEGRATFLSFERAEFVGMLAPAGTMPQEIELFASGLTMAMQALSQQPPQQPMQPGVVEQLA